MLWSLLCHHCLLMNYTRVTHAVHLRISKCWIFQHIWSYLTCTWNLIKELWKVMHSFMMKNLIPLPPASLLLTELHLHHISRRTKVRLHATNFFTFFSLFFSLFKIGDLKNRQSKNFNQAWSCLCHWMTCMDFFHTIILNSRLNVMSIFSRPKQFLNRETFVACLRFC